SPCPTFPCRNSPSSPSSEPFPSGNPLTGDRPLPQPPPARESHSLNGPHYR
ncbi:MAG: hypothetical protein HC890_10290, partial [Chloroflexaceae bacterium]|nr:hypothetical protein [Chloroflexaceae bacterium]